VAAGRMCDHGRMAPVADRHVVHVIVLSKENKSSHCLSEKFTKDKPPKGRQNWSCRARFTTLNQYLG
jgi:hypothetical protein